MQYSGSQTIFIDRKSADKLIGGFGEIINQFL